MTISDALLRSIFATVRTVAAVGVSTNPVRPSFYVARYLALKGFRVLPVNPAYPGESLFGEPIRASLSDIPDDTRVDMVDIFRRSDQVLPVVEEAIRVLAPRGLKVVWMQIGVINPEAAALAESAGLTVIMDRCPKIEYQRLHGELRMGGFNTGRISAKL
jgi:predicted CoA-binding protein